MTTLPAEFGNLTNLSQLDLHSNDLTTLPTEFGNLSNLDSLNLKWNSLTVLPSEFGDLTNLTSLELSNNNLTTLPAEIYNLTDLTVLGLSSNNLTTLPAEIGNLTNLTGLELSNNNLTVLPSEFGNLTDLTYLGLGDNNLNALPAEIGNLTNLTELRLDNNHLTALLPEFGDLANLTTLDLTGNRLTTLPPEFGNLINLTLLHLEHNTLTTLPSEFGNLSSLSWLILDYNNLTTLPPEFGNLSNLNYLMLGDNALTTLPPEFGNLPNLSWLELNNNNLTSLPPEFGNLANLSTLNMENNPLKGEIPFFLTQLSDLYSLNYKETLWCVPPSGPVREWLDQIRDVEGNDLTCTYPPATLILTPPSPLYAHIGATLTVAVTPFDATTPITFTWHTGDAAPIVHPSNAITDTAWLTWDTPGEHTLTVTAANAYSSVTTTQTVSIRPISATVVLPDAPARLTYTDTHGSPTTLDLPTGSVSQPAALLFWPKPDPAPIPAWRPAAHSFTLDLYRDGRPVLSPTFTNPLTLTLHYTDTDLAGIDRPNDLQLMRRDPDGWQPAACGPVSHDREQRALSLPLCQLGDFALFGPATLTKFVAPAATVENGSTLTYTLVFSDPAGGTLRLFDPLSPTLAWLGFVGAPPAGITFTHATSGTLILPHGALSGTLSLSPTHPLSLAFTVRVQLPEFAFRSQRSAVANTAFFCPTDANPCILHPSNTVSNPVFTAFIFLPFILRIP